MRDEGLRLTVYADSLGHPTIGYGRALDKKGVSKLEAEMMLDNDIQDVWLDIASHLPWVADLDEPRQEVFANMAFNLGIRGLMGFRRMLAAAEQHDWVTAAAHGRDSKWAQQVGPRAHRLMRQLVSGERV